MIALKTFTRNSDIGQMNLSSFSIQQKHWISILMILGGGIILFFGLYFSRAFTEGKNKDGAELVKVPAGEFSMGSDNDEDPKFEKPMHKVYLDAFSIYKTEVTNEQFQKFVKEAGYKTEAEKLGFGMVFDEKMKFSVEKTAATWENPTGDSTGMKLNKELPVIQVSWNDALAYCQWAGGDLPSEAQWEKAARGDDERKFPWGNEKPNEKLSNYCNSGCPIMWSEKNIDDGFPRTSPVGNYSAGASPYGALDMAGNVSEWVKDRWGNKGYETTSIQKNPTGANTGSHRIIRGGNWSDSEMRIRTTSRSANQPQYASDFLGFRCIKNQ